MLSPRAMILRAPGTNCDHETAFAFDRAGAFSRRVHVKALTQKPSLMKNFQILCIPGGFSYGDDIASGRIFALELSSRLADVLHAFRDRGGLILGICNGFQVLLQTGLLLQGPANSPAQASRGHNHSGEFVDRWVNLRADPNACCFLQGLHEFELPVAHGEGRFVTRSIADFDRLHSAGQLVLRYGYDQQGNSTNPNGASGDVAGLCDPSGRVFGLMPHPERFITATQHPAWNGHLDADAPGAGLAIFANAVKAVS